MTGAKKIRRASAITAFGLVAAALMAGTAATPALASKPPPCRTSDLSVTLGPLDGGAGQRYTTLDFLTVGGRTCVLSDNLADFQFRGAGGVALPTDPDAPGSATTITLSPGVMGHLTLHWTVMDGKQFVPLSLTFTVPGSRGVESVVWNDEPVSGAGHLDVWNLTL